MNKFTWRLLALVAIASFNCGVRRSSVPTELQARATATVPFSFVMDLECTEMAASFPIDATLARQLVPPEYEVDLEADGKARGALVVQNCSSGGGWGSDLIIEFRGKAVGLDLIIEFQMKRIASNQSSRCG